MKSYKIYTLTVVSLKDTIISIKALIKEKILDKCVSINDQFEIFNYDKAYLN